MPGPNEDNVHAITQYRKDGKSEFMPAADQISPKLQMLEGIGALQNTFQTSSVPTKVVENKEDLDATMRIRQEGLQSERITVDGGLVTEIVHLQPGGSSPLHRTRTLDLIIVIEGEIQVALDGGEKRNFKRGDTLVLNGAGHRLTNVSAEGIWAKIYSVTIDASPIQVGGKLLEETWALE